MSRPNTTMFKNEFYDGQFVRSFYLPNSGTCDLGEVFETGRAIADTEVSPGGWYTGWNDRARSVEQAIASLDAKADLTDRRGAWLRASEYYRQAYFFLRHDLSDTRLIDAHASHVRCFEQALPLMECSVTPGRVPFEKNTLAAYFFAPDTSGSPRPTLIFPSGYDSTAQEGWKNAQVAIAHGYNALTFEGPGQGASLIVDRLTFRPDFSSVLAPVIDWLLTLPGVDPTKLVLVGRSFAGYLAPQAATREHRIAALVCDPPQPNMANRIPTGFIGKIAPEVSTLEMRFDANRREFFGSRMAAHGVSTVEAYFEALQAFNMLPEAGKISCPTLLIECEGDFAGGGSPSLAAALTCPVTTRTLTAAEGAGGHCAGLGQVVWQSVVYPWIARTIG